MPRQSPPTPTVGADPEHPVESERRTTGRARRKAEAEQAARRRQMLWVVGAVAVALIVAAGLIFVNRPRDAGAPIVAAEPIPASIALTGLTMGESNAPLNVVEWGDYQCPGCGIFGREIFPQMIDEYVEPGLMSFEYKPFSFLGEESFRAAEAALCAEDQGAFWPYHETLFQNQHGENLNAFSNERLKQIAVSLDLDTAAFNSCLDSGQKRADVDASAADARANGITSTPSVIVNGALLQNWQDWDQVKAFLDAELDRSQAEQ